MVTIQDRFIRAFNVLVEKQRVHPEDMKDALKNDDLCLMWLRNEANLWEDYDESDTTCRVDGVNYDPAHPDNLSAQVWNAFRIHNKFF